MINLSSEIIIISSKELSSKLICLQIVRLGHNVTSLCHSDPGHERPLGVRVSSECLQNVISSECLQDVNSPAPECLQCHAQHPSRRECQNNVRILQTWRSRRVVEDYGWGLRAGEEARTSEEFNEEEKSEPGEEDWNRQS